MRYGQILIAQKMGHELIAEIAGCEIPVVVASVSTKIGLAWSTVKGRYMPKGDTYTSIEVRDLCGSGIYHVAPELLRFRDDKIKDEIEKMERMASEE